jgi:tetratricopeptide (TPR) repeat protein
MAVNLMRQDKPADALRYYWLAVREDPDFIEAWADLGLAYIDLGAYKTAREVLELGRDRAPGRIDLMHLMGEACHAEGMALLVSASSPEKRLAAKGLIDRAAEWYGLALAKAEEEWVLSEQAASFYRLGEICYYVNLDGEGARAYWEKILKLHAPAPNLDLVLWTPEERRDAAWIRLRHDTHRQAALTVWQNWARGYLEQLDARKRAGLADLAPAQRISPSGRPMPLSYGSNAINPGRDDGRSLFSLPAQLGSPPAVPAAAAVAGPVRLSGPGGMAADYSFYARKNSDSAGPSAAPAYRGTRVGGNSAFSGGPEAPPSPNSDPYAFPARGRPRAAWNNAGPYGSLPGWDE